MTANELADELTAPLGKSGESTYSVATQAAAMLRAQHEAIKTLREAATELLWYTDQLEQIVYAPEEPSEVQENVASMKAALAATEALT